MVFSCKLNFCYFYTFTKIFVAFAFIRLKKNATEKNIAYSEFSMDVLMFFVSFFCRHRVKSPSPHSFRAIQLKNKITDTSLFAELVKHRHKHETEIKTLEHILETSSDPKVAAKEAVKEAVKDEVDSKKSAEELVNNIPMDIDDIPIPEDVKKVEDVKDIALPNHVADKPNNAAATVAPPPPQQPPLPPPQKPATEGAAAAENGGESKVKKMRKLPMPPGINQKDLEAIESPPSRSPTPPPPVRARTPPRRGIMNLPMPPGENEALRKQFTAKFNTKSVDLGLYDRFL